MPDAEIDKVLQDFLQTFTTALRQRFPKFDQFPEKAQIGLLDMTYSLGALGLFKGYPRFCTAVDAQDWKTCAREGARRNVSDNRNADLQQLFRDAAAGV